MVRFASLNDEATLDLQLKYAFYGQVVSSQSKQSDRHFQEQLLNLKYPGEWYPRTRGFQREFHVHVGPTNSGKTYHALKRLEEAEKGVYAGPLRLLAHEVYMRLNARGRQCSLLTGDERKFDDATDGTVATAPMISCTVEMLPLSDPFDVAVIDEIQMLGSEERGWAWTQALLGVMAREVHLCGEERSVPIIEELAAACGDRVVVHHYERLSPLKMMDHSLEGNLKSLEKGDCVVGFSIVVLHGLRQLVEKTTKKKCAIIYGSLPPETRAQQAKLFNDPDNEYDYLVATNAVGMGLNLSIKRLVFQTAHRNVKGRLEAVSIPEIKQIAGRAGRYSTASDDMKTSTSNSKVDRESVDGPLPSNAAFHASSSSTERPLRIEQNGPQQPIPLDGSADPSNRQLESERRTSTLTARKEKMNQDSDQTYAERTQNEASRDIAHPTPRPRPSSLGLVTTLEKLDYNTVARAMNSNPDPIASAGILPPDSIIEKFARYFPTGTPLSYLLLRLDEISSTSRRFHVCDLKGQIGIADAIEPIQNISISDRLTICAAPIETRKEGEADLARAYASLVGQNRGANVLEIEELNLELLEDEYNADRAYLKQLEHLHKGIIIFLWLSFRFTGIFLDQPLASHVKELAEQRIAETLEKLSFNYKQLRRTRDQALLDLLEDEEDSREPSGNAGDGQTMLGQRSDEQIGRRSDEELDTIDELGKHASDVDTESSEPEARDLAVDDEPPEVERTVERKPGPTTTNIDHVEELDGVPSQRATQ